MPDKIANPIPAWLTESPSVLDSPLKRAMQMIGSLIGADNPTSQVLGMAGAMEVPGKLGGLAGAVDRLLTKAGIKAYHGSPHDFDAFSTEKIGTGEGAQAYGHGLYFAENEAVAKGYRDALSGNAIVSPGMAAKHGYDPFPEEVKGRVYEVNIAAHPDDFLDWDKPLSQQSETVRAALAKTPDPKTSRLLPRETEISGADVYEGIGKRLWWDKQAALRDKREAASEALRQVGIPGIKYLDAGSRTAGDGSRNYVVFDDKLVSILKKYGVAGALAAGYSQSDVDAAQSHP